MILRRIDLRPVRATLRALRTTPFLAALASVLVVIARTRGKHDFALHSSSAGRDVVGTEHLIGCFTLERFWTLADDPRRSVRSLLAQLAEQSAAHHANGLVPFMRELGLPSQLVTAFNFAYTIDTRSPRSGAAFPTAQSVVPSSEVPTADFDVGIWTIETPIELVYRAGYRTDLFTRATIERFLDRYERLFRFALANADAPLDGVVAAAWARDDLER